MLRCLWITLLLLTPPLQAEPFQAANAPGAVGETGGLFLLEQGFFGRPFYNDVFGKTDKQLTGATQLGYLRTWSDSSLEVRTQWRFLTPSFRETFHADELEIPVGRYADWMELQSSWAKVFETSWMPMRLQFSLGLGDVGNHGARQVHRRIHQWVGSSLFGLEYTDQPTGRDISMGVEWGVIDRDVSLMGHPMQSLVTLGFARNRFMEDIYLQHNLVSTISDELRVALESRLPLQIGSEAYEDTTRRMRFEWAFGLRYKWYRPSIKYLSPFLKGDDVGQFYFDPLAFFVAW